MSRERILTILAKAIVDSGDQLREHIPFLDPPRGRAIYRIPDGLVEALATEPLLAGISGQMFNQRDHAGTIGFHQIAEALIDRALDVGTGPAVEELYRSLGIDYNPCIEVAMLAGITVNEPVEVSEGIFLVPLRDVPSTTMQAYLAETASAITQHPNFSPSALLNISWESKCHAVLYRDIEVRPKFLAPGSLQPVSNSAADRLLGSIANLLVLTVPSTAAISRTFVELRDGEILKDKVSHAAGWVDLGSSLTNAHAVSPQEIADIRTVVGQYMRLSEEERIALDVPLHRLNEATRSRSFVDRALDLGIAFESLLLSDNSDHNQLTLKFKLHGAWLLGEDLAKRTEIFEQLGRLYAYRSAAAHAGQTKQIKKFNVELDLQDGLRLCASAIREVISRGGRPQWASLLLGGAYGLPAG